MMLHRSTAVTLVLTAVLTAFVALHAQSKPPATCEASRLVSAEPPRDPNADPFGYGPWYINESRTIWAGWGAGRWLAGRNKALWIRPAGTRLKIEGQRIDGPAPELRTTIPCCHPTGF